MRIPEEPIQGDITELLMELKVPYDVAMLSTIYLFGKEEEIPDKLLEKLPKLNFSPLTWKQRNLCAEVLLKDSFKNNLKLQRRWIHLCYQMGGASTSEIVKIFKTVYELKQIGISREQFLNISAEYCVFDRNNYNWKQIKYWMKLTDVLPEEIPPLLEKCSKDASNGKIFLLNVYFYLKEQQAGYHPKQQDPELFEKFEDLVTVNMDTIFNIRLKEEEDVLKEYLNHANKDTEIPFIITRALHTGQMNSYLVKLLAGAAFLHYSYSIKLENFIRIITAKYYKTVLRILYDVVPEDYFKTKEIEIDERFLIPKRFYFRWLAEHNEEEVLSKKLQKKGEEQFFIEAVKACIHEGHLSEAGKLLSFLTKNNISFDPKLKAEIMKIKSDAENKIIQTAGEHRKTNRSLIQDYFAKKEPISSLIEKEKELRNSAHDYSWNNVMSDYIDIAGHDEFYERTLIFLLIARESKYYVDYLIYEITNGKEKESFLDNLFQICKKYEVPIYYPIELVQNYYNEYYTYETAKAEKVKNRAQSILARYAKTNQEELIETLQRLKPIGRIMILEALLQADEKNDILLLNQFGDTSKQVRETLIALLTDKKDSRDRIIEKLSSKKAAERETAMRILCANKEEETCRKALEQALKTEKSEKLAAYLRKQLEIEDIEKETVQDYIKELLKGNKKRSLTWLYETPMPVVHNQNKEVMTEEYMQAVLLSYATLNPVGVNLKTKCLTKELDQKELEEFCQAVFDRWLNKGAESKKKWVLYFVAVYGGNDMIAKLKYQISEWPRQARGAIAVDAIQAMACNGGSLALMTVDAISRKFKYRQIKEAARTALTRAAKELEISAEELSDRIVPNLGFSENCSRTFDYGFRTFQVMITPALELEVFDEKQKKLKNLPAPGAKDDPEKAQQAYQEFKEMKKLLKTTVAAQQARLEFALSTERRWSVTAWKTLFIKNPIMHSFAIGLIWGAYQGKELKETFRYMEDGTFTTVEEEEYQLLDETKIGLVHPLELSKEQIEAWKEQLSDYEIVQPVIQLERKIYKVEPEEEDKKELERFGGYVINHLSLASKLMADGWSRGSVLDGGGYYEFYKEDIEQNIGVQLSFSGAYVGADNEDVTLYEVLFYQPGTLKRGSYVYDQIELKNAYTLKDVPKLFFSETVYQISKILSGISRKDPDWKKHR